jgi:hypothetical protein
MGSWNTPPSLPLCRSRSGPDTCRETSGKSGHCWWHCCKRAVLGSINRLPAHQTYDFASSHWFPRCRGQAGSICALHSRQAQHDKAAAPSHVAALTTRLAVTMPRMPYVRQGLFSPTHTVLLMMTSDASANQSKLAATLSWKPREPFSSSPSNMKAKLSGADAPASRQQSNISYMERQQAGRLGKECKHQCRFRDTASLGWDLEHPQTCRQS